MGAESIRGATKVPHGLETENYELHKCGQYPIGMRPFELNPKTNHERFSPKVDNIIPSRTLQGK